MIRAPLLLPAIALLAAIVAEQRGVTLSAAVCAIAIAAFRRDVALSGLIGLAVSAIWGHPAVVDRERPTARYSGVVVSDVRSEGGAYAYALTVDGVGTLHAVGTQRVRAGERLTVRARISPIDEPRNPGEPSARAIALDDGMIGELAIQRILKREPPDRSDPRIWAALCREMLSAYVRRALPEPEATVLAGALWGERGSLPQDVRDDFQATGTVHVLVTAGLHLGVIAALATTVFALLQLPRIGAALATIPLIFSYAWLSGWHLPSQRAAVMITIALIARACGARALSLNSLAVAAIVVAAFRPVAVQSISFVLSFSCVAAIVLFAQPLTERLAAFRVPHVIAEGLALTFATQVGVWPLTAATFFNVAPYAMLANAIVVPTVSLVLLGGIATIVTHPVVTLSAVFASWTTWLLAAVLLTTHAIAQLPGARLRLTPPPAWAIAAYDGAVVVCAALIARKRSAAAFVFAGACTFVGLTAWLPRTNGFSITALDVGQGDALVIRTPHGRTVLIDTGGKLERGPPVNGKSPAERSAERIVLPYLQRAGITSIDALILTHPHGDHVGGTAGILRLMPVGWIADSGQRYGGHAYNDGLAEARRHRVPVIVPACHQRWVDDEVQLTFLTPCGPPFTDGANDVNENSLVVLVQYGILRALFMGDAGFQSEERLLVQGVDLRADILKVGHHGSAYSSSPAFIEAVHPRFAIVSVGRHNLFGHPASSTLETLRRAGASIFRTDRCGAVAIAAGVAATPTISSMLSCTSASSSHE